MIYHRCHLHFAFNLVRYGEGWFDPWLLLCHFKNKVSSMGVHVIEGEVHDIDMNQNKVSGVKVGVVHLGQHWL